MNQVLAQPTFQPGFRIVCRCPAMLWRLNCCASPLYCRPLPYQERLWGRTAAAGRRRPGGSGLIRGAEGPLTSRTTSRQPVVMIERTNVRGSGKPPEPRYGRIIGEGDAVAQLITTLGPRNADELGPILPHEHVFVDLRTWDKPGHAQADAADVIALIA